MKILVRILFLLITVVSYAQNMLNGEIANSGDTEGIHVFNKTYSKYTITDAEGKFSISAQLQDTIVFSALQYELKELVITPKILKNYQYVLLKTKTNELDAVYIMPKLSGILSKDAKRIKTRKIFEFGLSKKIKKAGMGLGVMPVDGQSKVTNDALGTTFHGVDIIGLIKFLIPTKQKNTTPKFKLSLQLLKSYYGDTFFENALHLRKDDQERYIEFIIADSVVDQSLISNDKMKLLAQLLLLRTQFEESDK